MADKKKGPGRPAGSKNKRRRRNRKTVPVAALTNGADTASDPVLAGFQSKRTQYQGELTAMQTKLANLDASEKAYIEGAGGNVAAMGIPTDILLTAKGTIDMRSDRGRAFVEKHPEFKGKVIQS